MSTQVLVRKLNKEVSELKDDLRGLKEFLFAPLKDSEGEYTHSFVRKMLLRSQRDRALYTFRDQKSFLAHVQSKKRTRLR